MRRWRSSLTLLLTFLLLAAALVAPTNLAARELLAPEEVAPADATESPARFQLNGADSTLIRQGYDLLLDRYVQPLNPADLLGAAYTGVVKGLADAGVTVRDAGPLLLDPNRERAWSTFVARLGTVLQESPPPNGFNVNAVALSSMARWVDEGHTAYLSPQQYQDFLAQMRGDVRYGGIGIRPRRPEVTISEVFPGSPAEAAGLLAGDVIRAVNGQSIEGQTLEQVAALIRGPEGTVLQLSVFRPRTGQSLQVSLVRALIRLEFVTSEVIQGSVAYVRLRGFADPTVADRFEQVVNRLPPGTRGLVIDLRGNPGGRIDIGLRLLNRFIPSGALWDQIDRSGRHRVQTASGPGWDKNLPVVVLIDGASASMSEIFAAAMREHGVARVIGAPSAGNVAGAQAFPLSDGSAMQVTVLEIFTGKGERLNRTGVIPDQVLDSSPEELDQGRDLPLEAAVLHIWAESDKAANRN